MMRPCRVSDALEVLDRMTVTWKPPRNGHRFLSRLLKDWWSSRFRDHHVALERPLLKPSAAVGNTK